MKSLETVDFKQHLREFYRIFLPLFLVFAGIAIFAWNKFRPNDSAPDPVPWIEKSGQSLVGLLNPTANDEGEATYFDPAFAVLSPIEMVQTPTALHFDPPMGSEHLGLTYNAQPFLTTRHLGDDFNGIGGEHSDLGDPVYAVADGSVIYTGWPSDGWGNVVIILHRLPDGRLVESFYGHLDKINTTVGNRIRRGDKLGTVGNANRRYFAHLHFELRTSPTLDCGAGYADNPLDRLSGELSLRKWRGRPDDRLSGPPRGATPESILNF